MKKPKAIIVNQYLQSHYNQGRDFRYDVLSGKIQVRGDVWHDITDRDLSTIAMRCAEETNSNVAPKDVLTALQSEDLVKAVHPLRDWLDHLPQYAPERSGGMDLIKDMGMHVHVAGGEEQQTLWLKCFHRWFLAMVHSWRCDEVVNHQVLVLIGPQGIYKTTWLEHILPPELRQYQCKQASSRELGKDDRMRVAEFGLINRDETDALNEHNDTFRVPRNEEDLLEVYFQQAHREDEDAKFMTASEILGKLKLWGSIEHSMPINKFGQLLQKRGFIPTFYRGQRGYVVMENSTPSQSQKDIAKNLLNERNQ